MVSLEYIRMWPRLRAGTGLLLSVAFAPLFPCDEAWADEKGNLMKQSLVETYEDVKGSVVALVTEDKDKEDRDYKIQGTGFFIHSSGLIATAAHVAEVEHLLVVFEDKIHKIEIIESDLKLKPSAKGEPVPEHSWDIAIVKIDLDDRTFPFLRLSKTTKYPPGTEMAMLGWPEGGAEYTIGADKLRLPLLSKGIVASSFSLETVHKDYGSRLALDIAAAPSSSGSPAFLPTSPDVVAIAVQMMGRKVLSPSDKPNVFNNVPVSIGFAYANPVVAIRDWLKENDYEVE